MTADHTIGRRKFYVGTVRKADIVINKKHDNAVYKETKKDDHCQKSRLTQISQWRKPTCHKHLLANETARILCKRRNGVFQLFNQQAVKVIYAIRKSATIKHLHEQERLSYRRNINGTVLACK